VHRATKPNGDPVWVISRYDQVRALLADSRLSLNAGHALPGYTGFGLPPALDRHLLNVDAADHARLRRLLSTAFTTRRVDRLRDDIQTTADRLLDEFLPHGQADLVAQFAAPLPITVICDLLGVPVGEGQALHAYTSALMGHVPSDQSPQQIVGDMLSFFVDLIDRKRTEPGDDLLTAMIQAHEGDDRLSSEELTSNAFVILWAGYQNSVHLIAVAAYTLLTHPDLAAVVRAAPDPHCAAVTRIVDEVLRHSGPVMVSIRRFPLEDIRLGEATIQAGETVLLALASANRDPAIFADPDFVDPHRVENPHLGFGYGPHYCLGANLARLETRTALWSAFHRLPDLALAGPEDRLTWIPDYGQHGLTALPVTFRADAHPHRRT
jgi:cytochrome P450